MNERQNSAPATANSYHHYDLPREELIAQINRLRREKNAVRETQANPVRRAINRDRRIQAVHENVVVEIRRQFRLCLFDRRRLTCPPPSQFLLEALHVLLKTRVSAMRRSFDSFSRRLDSLRLLDAQPALPETSSATVTSNRFFLIFFTPSFLRIAPHTSGSAARPSESVLRLTSESP